MNSYHTHKLIFSFLLLFVAFQVAAQNVIQLDLKWNDQERLHPQALFNLENGVYQEEYKGLPVVIQKIAGIDLRGRAIHLKNSQFEQVAISDQSLLDVIENEILIQSQTNRSRNKTIAHLEILPFRKNNGQIERLVKAEIHIGSQQSVVQNNSRAASSFATQSVLATGDIYALSIQESGVFKIDYNTLQELGINVNSINPQHIKLYGNTGGMLPELAGEARVDDLAELAIEVVGESDGSFDQNDYIRFYSNGPSQFKYDDVLNRFSYSNNIYDTKSYVFLKIDGASPSNRIGTTSSISGAVYSTSTFDGYAHYEVDETNLLDISFGTSGTGRLWLGESFRYTQNQTFNLEMPNLVTSEPVIIETSLAARSIGAASQFQVRIDGQTYPTQNLVSVNGGSVGQGGSRTVPVFTHTASSSTISVNLNYIKVISDAAGYLDYITINGRQNLIKNSSQLAFRDTRTLSYAQSNFSIANTSSNTRFWDITDPLNPSVQQGSSSGSEFTFGANTTSLKEFIAFNPGEEKEIQIVGTIPNQNLHGILTPKPLLIITNTALKPEAQRLAQHRLAYSNIDATIVDVQEIYNEFSAGSKDISAIRDFIKMLYDRSGPSGDFKYVLLFGDASFDYRNINENEENYDIIPTYQTRESLSAVSGYPTDDYFGLLDDTEGANIESGGLDIAIGRIPARTIQEAKNVVDKIIHYETNPNTFSDWKNRITYIADDQDGNTHFNDSDGIAEAVRDSNNFFNITKIYADAYQQLSTPGGNRYPDVTAAIVNEVTRGNLIINYMGHGGHDGWAQERILTMNEINSFDNYDKLPLFVTATCTFAPYEDPTYVSAGETLVMNPNGGAIALFTTTRAVYAYANRLLGTSAFDALAFPPGTVRPPIGEILRTSKNNTTASIQNSRKFVLLGDPSMALAYPTQRVSTISINGVAPNADTLNALEPVTIKGEITDPSGSRLTDFNGTIYPTVFDKVATYSTRGNDNGSTPANFQSQDVILFRGRAQVVNGEWEFSFTVPLDINYTIGNGRISYYAEDGNNREAIGFDNTIIIGGANSTGVTDDTPPLVEVFMNDSTFVFGGTTDADPKLYVRISDDLGINTTGTGIGHDITATLDDNSSEVFILNDFYESELNNSKKGSVLYGLFDLPEGKHTIKVRAWDVANNPGEGETEFIVAESGQVALEHVLNYPNPFTTNTEFQFEHNFPNQPLTVQVQIFTVAGKLVKTIEQQVISDGYRVTGLQWNGTDDYGDNLARGVYIYRVNVATQNEFGGIITKRSDFEKLVLLK